MARRPERVRIVELDPKPVHHLSFLNAAKRGGIESQALPILRGRVAGLSPELDGLVLTSDLQGVVSSYAHGGQNVLLGVEVVEVLMSLADDRVIPDPSSVGVILAGDLYSAPGGNVRGATGDVRDVWEAFAESFRWVSGVAGNHDQFGTDKEQRRFEAQERVHLLDARTIELDSLLVGGLGYIMGDPSRLGRRSEHDFLAGLALTLEMKPDVLVLHEGPDGAGRRQRGSGLVHREIVDDGGVGLVVCGHVHWEQPVAELKGGAQVVNVDTRVIVLSRA